MKVLVTGAAGLLGSSLVDRLLAEGHTVTGLDDLSTGRLANLSAARATKGLSFARFDVLDDALPALVARDRPDVVCHLAARGDPDRSATGALAAARTDVLGTVNVLEACLRAEVPRVVLASSAQVYGEPTALPVTERAALAPVSARGAAQVAAEGYLFAYGRRHGPAGVALRLGSLYGPRQDPAGGRGVVAVFAAALLAGRPTRVDGDGTAGRDFLHVRDAVEGVLRCLDGRADGRRLNLGTGTVTAVREVHTLVAVAAGVPDAPSYGPARVDEPPAVALDSGAARRALGWEPAVRLADGIADTVAELRGRP